MWALAGRLILAPLASLWRYLTADPARLAFAVLVALCAFLAWRLASVDGDRDKWRDRVAEMEAASKVVTAAAAKADTAALDTAKATKGQTDAVTEQARDAARQSDDPLDAVAHRLRAESDRGRN